MLVCKMNFGSLFSCCGSNNHIGQSALKQALSALGKKDNLAFADEISTVGQVYHFQYIFGAF